MQSPDEARAALKAQVVQTAEENGHTLGPWLDVGHASQTGCLQCDRYAFIEIVPPPGKVHIGQMGESCPKPGLRPLD